MNEEIKNLQKSIEKMYHTTDTLVDALDLMNSDDQVDYRYYSAIASALTDIAELIASYQEAINNFSANK